VIRWRHRLLALVAALVMAPEAPASIFEYLHVEANAGSSAGGHFALRLDNWVYDFQNAELGTLRLRRTDYDLFRYLYTVLENRTMHIARIDVPRETREAIFDRFNRRYLIQNKQFSTLDSLRGDRELIRLLLARSDNATSPEGDRATSSQGDRANSPEADPATPPERKWSGMRIRGAGFFYDGHSEEVGGESPSLRALRDRLASNHGQTYLTDRIVALEHAAEGLSPSPELDSAAMAHRGARPESSYHFSDRYRDLSAKIVALRALENATRIRPTAPRKAGRFAPSRNGWKSVSQNSSTRSARTGATRCCSG